MNRMTDLHSSRYQNGVDYHVLKLTYKDGTVEDIWIADEKGEDCNVYDRRAEILADPELVAELKTISVVAL